MKSYTKRMPSKPSNIRVSAAKVDVLPERDKAETFSHLH